MYEKMLEIDQLKASADPWLDRLCNVHRLTHFQTTKELLKSCEERERQRPLPISETQFILKYGKKAWREMKSRS
jgi:hypothetical protein